MDTVGMELAMIPTVRLFYDFDLTILSVAVDRSQESKVSPSLRFC